MRRNRVDDVLIVAALGLTGLSFVMTAFSGTGAGLQLAYCPFALGMAAFVAFGLRQARRQPE